MNEIYLSETYAPNCIASHPRVKSQSKSTNYSISNPNTTSILKNLFLQNFATHFEQEGHNQGKPLRKMFKGKWNPYLETPLSYQKP
jgi:hypothetical protein